MTERYTVNLDPAEPCPSADGWAAFWAKPPTSINDPDLADFREWVAQAFKDLDFGEDFCPHCLDNARRALAHVQALEDAARAQRPSDVTDL
jgi:hypothetical protein